jgi:hypothetical protein
VTWLLHAATALQELQGGATPEHSGIVCRSQFRGAVLVYAYCGCKYAASAGVVACMQLQLSEGQLLPVGSTGCTRCIFDCCCWAHFVPALCHIYTHTAHSTCLPLLLSHMHACTWLRC